MPDLPTGTVTMLFSDIEGSTRLLQQLGERYASLLEACRSLLRAAFLEFGGHEVDTQGDAFFVAFARATDAVAAAVAGQRTLFTHAWQEGMTVRVRMGLHTGEPFLATEGYVGLDVHRAARIMSAGHGGQILLSQTTRDLVEHALPEGVYLVDLGAHRLKDLQQSSHLFQIVIAGLPDDFPPLKTLNASPNNLPIQPTPFIGREREVAAVTALLRREEMHLVTLTGPGGTGKTRLGLQVAAELSEVFPGGVFFVNLAPLSDPASVVPAIAQVLNVNEMGGQPAIETLKASLREKHLLLLVDNFEQVVQAAPSIAELLAACTKLKIMVTSRMALHVRAEQEFAVPSLLLPDPKHLPDAAVLSQYEAVALFIARAQAARPEFQVTNTNAPAVAEICVRLDGLPLAIELAAARIKLLPPLALLARLGQRFAVLTGGAPARQQTLRSTIEWSYHLLDTAEQRLFRRLCVFVGGCRLEAVEAVCSTLDEGKGVELVLDGVASLIDKSLLQQVEQPGEEPRLRPLETIREYGLEWLTTSGEREATRHAHALYYLALAERSDPELGGPEPVSAAMWLDPERENFRAALQWLLERKERELALRLAGALWLFWTNYGPVQEGLHWLEQALRDSEGVRASVRAKALFAVWQMAIYVGQGADEFAPLVEESLVRARAEGDRAGIAQSLMLLGQLASERGNFEEGLALYEESLLIHRALEDRVGIAEALFHEGEMYLKQGKFARASELFEESLTISRLLGDTQIAGVLYYLGCVTSARGDYVRAHAFLRECLGLYRESKDKRGICIALEELARAAFLQGDQVAAAPLVEESLAIAREIDDRLSIVSSLRVLGEVILSQDDLDRAYPLLEESAVLSKEVGNRRNIAWSLCAFAKAAARRDDLANARVLYQESFALASELGLKPLIASCLEGVASIVATQGDPLWAARLWGTAESLRDVMGTPIPPVDRAIYERSVSAVRTPLATRILLPRGRRGAR